jgi:O-antigen/teichoic acid export membrane protein
MEGAKMSGTRIFKNASYLFLSNVVVRFLTAITTILIARTLGAEDYGILSVALAFAAVAGYFTDLGLTHTLMREATKPGANLPVLMSSFFRIRLFFAFITAVLSVFIFETVYPEPTLKLIMYWVVLPTIVGAALQGVGAAYYQVIEKMHLTAIIRTIAGLSTSIALILGMIFDWPLLIIGPIYGFANVLAGVVSIIIVVKSVSILKGWDKSILNGLISFMLSGLTIMLLPQLGPIILEKVSSLKEVGYYSAAYRIPAVLYQIPGIVAAAFYPVLFRYGNENKLEQHISLNIVQLKVMSFLGIIMALPFLLFSSWWISILFGFEWIDSSSTLAVLSLIVLIQAISYPIADALTTTGSQNKRMIILLSGLFLSIPLYFYLGKSYGSIGGAIAAISTELFLLLGFTLIYKKGLVLLYKGFSKNAIAFAITLILSNSLQVFIHPLVGTIVAVVIFVMASLLLDKELRVKGLELVLAKIKKRRRATN